MSLTPGSSIDTITETKKNEDALTAIGQKFLDMNDSDVEELFEARKVYKESKKTITRIFSKFKSDVAVMGATSNISSNSTSAVAATDTTSDVDKAPSITGSSTTTEDPDKTPSGPITYVNVNTKYDDELYIYGIKEPESVKRFTSFLPKAARINRFFAPKRSGIKDWSFESFTVELTDPRQFSNLLDHLRGITLDPNGSIKKVWCSGDEIDWD